MPPLVAVIPATNAGIEIAKSCFRASILLRTSGNLRKAHTLLAAVLAEIKGNPAMEIYAKVQRDKLLKIYDDLLLEQSVWQDNRAKTIKKRWNPQTMYQAYRHLLEAQNLYDLSKRASDAATRQAMNQPTVITDPNLLMDVLFGAFAGLAVKEQQGIPNNVANMPVISDRPEPSGPIAAGSLVDLGRSKPAAKVSLADFPASSVGLSQACISETNPFVDPTSSASTSDKAVELKNIGSKKAGSKARRH